MNMRASLSIAVVVWAVALAATGCEKEEPGEADCVENGQFCAGVEQTTLGSGTWHTDGAACLSTVYVRQGASGGDGSQGSPLGDLPAAAAVAGAGDCIALASGTYTGASVSGSVSVLGRGSAQTTITGDGSEVLSITAGDGGLYRGVLITGAGVGVVLDSADNVTFESVLVREVSGMGVLIRNGRYFTLEQSRIAWVNPGGVEQVGVGLVNLGGPGIVVRRSLIEECAGTALAARNADLSVENSVIRNNEGYGVAASCVSCGDTVPVINVTGTEIHGNTGVGLWFNGVAPTVSQCVVTGTRRTFDGFSRSLEIVAGEPFLATDNILGGGEDIGVYLASAAGELSDNVVEDHQGRGIWVQQIPGDAGPFLLELVGNVVSRNAEIGIGVKGDFDLLLSGGAIGETATKQVIVDNQLDEVGDGVQLLTGSTATVQDVTVVGNGRAGVLVDGASGFTVADNQFGDHGELAIVVQNMVSWDPTDSIPPGNLDLEGGDIGYTEFVQPEDFLGWDPTDVPVSWDPTDRTF